MKKTIVLLALLSAACVEKTSPQQHDIDQCMRREIFSACLKAVPVGPSVTHDNVWDEVIAKCESAAYYQSLRPREFIKPECLPGK